MPGMILAFKELRVQGGKWYSSSSYERAGACPLGNLVQAAWFSEGRCPHKSQAPGGSVLGGSLIRVEVEMR